MTWKVNDAMSEKMRLIGDCLSGEFSTAELARLYNISRPTCYKWIERYKKEGVDGLKERSRAPTHHPNQVHTVIEKAILDARAKHPHWGAPKLLAWLERNDPRLPWPVQSTVGEILKRHGLSVPRRKRRRATPNSQPLRDCKNANDLWCVDFKGWFRCADGAKCWPLTITDAHSRFILRRQAMGGPTGFEAVKPLFEATFRQFGLPAAIRSDNGPPFATTGLGGLSLLSVWWIRLGIRPERIRPGKPQENGRHERMHRTLKQETAAPPKRNLRAQQRAFDRFVVEFNTERPHQALGNDTPNEHYEPSPRPYSSRLPEQKPYHDDWSTRKVRKGGQMKWNGHDVRLTNALWGQRIGLEPVGEGLWRVHFADIALGIFDERTMRVQPLQSQRRKRK